GQARGERAHDRAGDEERERNDDHRAAAIDVAQCAEHGRDRGGGEQIGGNDPGQAGDAWNWRPIVGSAVATMVWSSAARNIASIRLARMARTSSLVSGARGGASSRAITWVGNSGSAASICWANPWAKEWGAAGRRFCRSCLFMMRCFLSVAPPWQRRFA